MKKVTIKAKNEYKPRVMIRGNTGTRIIVSKKDKAKSRQKLKLQIKKYY